MQEALSKPVPDRAFESSSYQAQARAQIAAEKVRTVEGYLAEMQKVWFRIPVSLFHDLDRVPFIALASLILIPVPVRKTINYY